MIELALGLEEMARRKAGRKIYTLYPDEGPLRRGLYKKHMLFFKLGATVGTRGMIAANRIGKCISADTLIECPDGTERKVSEIKGLHLVWAWDGEKRVPAMALPPFVKPAEMVYRVWLSSGQWFDCAEEHQLLTSSGWLFFSDLLPSLQALPPSTSEFGLLESAEDALRCLNKARGSRAYYQAYHCSGDEQPQSAAIVSPVGLSNSIVCYQQIGVQDIYDFTVPEYENYCTRGAVHHNTWGVGGYELVLHLTGRYPDWWEGARFDAPVRSWAAGDTSKTVRDIIQDKLLGKWGSFGTGLIPFEDYVRHTSKSGVPEAVDTLWVKHYNEDGDYDGDSGVVFKSYDQKREAFQGTEQDIIWLDEEADEAIRGECILRLMTTDGLLMETFTPLKGLTPVVLQYLPSGEAPADGSTVIGEDKALVMAGWDDVPHLGEKEKARMLAETPPYLRDARSKGIPSMGAGAIYPVPESEIKVPDFHVPAHWPRLAALDVGWNRTAALWAAWDKENDIIYLTGEYYRGQAEPVIHATAIQAKGKWMPIEIDPAARGRGQDDGKRLFDAYTELGLNLGLANNTVESGLYDVWGRLSTGRLKAFASLTYWFSEYRMYHRNEKGILVKENDHLMDDTRYLINAKPERWLTRKPEAPLRISRPAPHVRGLGM